MIRLTRIVRPLGVVGAILTTLFASPGCTHNYYYTGANPCAPGTTAVLPGAVQYGSMCEVPSKVEGGVAVVDPNAGSSIVTTPLLGGARPPRVVVSEPGAGPRLSSNWRRSDPDSSSLMSTRVEGGTSDSRVTR